MLKYKEQTDDQSCWNKAFSSEMVFVLLERDAAAPAAIRAWIAERIRLGKNSPGDKQLFEALRCAEFIEKNWRETLECVHEITRTQDSH